MCDSGEKIFTIALMEPQDTSDALSMHSQLDTIDESPIHLHADDHKVVVIICLAKRGLSLTQRILLTHGEHTNNNYILFIRKKHTATR
jgi:hypothetical protein